MGPEQGLGRRALQEGAGRGLDGSAEKIVARRVTDIELDPRVEGREIHEVGRPEVPRFARRLRRERFLPQFRDRSNRRDAKDSGALLRRGCKQGNA